MTAARKMKPTPTERAAGVTQEASQATLDSIRAGEHPRCLMCGAANTHGMKLRLIWTTATSVPEAVRQVSH